GTLPVSSFDILSSFVIGHSSFPFTPEYRGEGSENPAVAPYNSLMNTAILCQDLRKRYPARPVPVDAVNGLDLEVYLNDCFGLRGPSGAGKTTTIEILEGLLAPTSGTVEVLGRRWGDNDDELRQRLGISLQETRLAEKLTVRETLTLFRSFYRAGATPDAVL